jgi:hypothetical protein
VEVFFGVYKHIIWFLQKHTWKEIVQHFSDLWVRSDVLFVLVNELVLSDR